MVRGSDRYDPTPWNPDGRPYFRGFNPERVPSPCYVIDRAAVEWNLRILREVADRAGATMLLALKAFAPPPLFLGSTSTVRVRVGCTKRSSPGRR